MEAKISKHKARLIGNILNVDWHKVDFGQFKRGMEVESEHGSSNPRTDVTHDDLVAWGKIALAHLGEMPDYYTRLDKMEKAGKKKLKEFDTGMGSRPINMNLISEELIEVLGNKLGLDLRKVVGDEFRIGIIAELDKMATYTTEALTNEKLIKAAMTAYENLMEIPSFYSNPPKEEIAHVLTGKQFAPYRVNEQKKILSLREIYLSGEDNIFIFESRKFLNLNEFKNLAKNETDPPTKYLVQQIYLEKHGMTLGEGSSRIVYLVDSKRVLKFAKRNSGEDITRAIAKGRAQNEAELSVYTNPKLKPIVAEIFDYDPELNWLVSELVRPISTREEFTKLTGIEDDDEIWSLFATSVTLKEKMREKYKNNKLVRDLIEAVDATNLLPGDLAVYIHWGKTAIGRPVLLDYGFTEDVATAHYDR